MLSFLLQAELARLLLETESTNQPERSGYGGYGATYGIDGLTGRQQHAEDIVDLTGDDDNVIDLTIEDNLTEVKVKWTLVYKSLQHRQVTLPLPLQSVALRNYH